MLGRTQPIPLYVLYEPTMGHGIRAGYELVAGYRLSFLVAPRRLGRYQAGTS
jgi:hypothetical protein